MSPSRFGIAFGIAAALLGVLLCDPAVGFGDAGELGAAASTWGVAHPTGFPLALLWTHLVELLPLGSIAFRHALSASLAGALVVGVLTHLIASKNEDPRVAFAGCFVTAAGVLGWLTTLDSLLSMEVYALSMLVIALAMHESQIGRRPAVLGLCVGLAAATHVVALMATVLLCLSTRRRTASALGVAAVLGFIGAALVFYLPLASLRQPALDWGDPETLGRFVEHLSAARIRDAFVDAPSRPLVLFEQLAELAPLLLPALYAWVRVSRTRMLLVLALADVAYGLWVNPMGVPERQVGHLFGLAVSTAAGLGVVAVLSDLQPSPSLRVPAIACALFLGATGLRGVPRHEGAGWSVQERFEDALVSAPARSVLLCGTDEGCAIALALRYGWGVRPDVDVLVPQHLWEPRDRARLSASQSTLPTFESSARPTASERAGFVQRAMSELVAGVGRPLESQDAMGLPQGRVAGVAVIGEEDDTWEGLLRLEALADASSPQSPRARAIWARQLDQVGKLGLSRGHVRASAAAFRAGIELAPERSVGWSNLGVVLANAGDLEGAITATRAAVDRDPERLVAWVNLAGYHAQAGDLAGARDVARRAVARGLEDPRLSSLLGNASQ